MYLEEQLITKKSDYTKFGYDVTKVQKPHVYREQVLTKGYLPIAITFKAVTQTVKPNLETFLQVETYDSFRFGDMKFKYYLLVREDFIRIEPVYEDKIESVPKIPPEMEFSFSTTSEYEQYVSSVTEYEDITVQVKVGEKEVPDYRYVWKEIKCLKELELHNSDTIIVNIVGTFSARLGHREVQLMPKVKVDTFSTYLDIERKRDDLDK